MKKLLKGNYDLKNNEHLKIEIGEEKDAISKFEDSALERLGGSIAFVMKGKKFLWDEDEAD